MSAKIDLLTVVVPYRVMGRPRIREKLWEKAVRKASAEGMSPSEVVEDALAFYFENVKEL